MTVHVAEDAVTTVPAVAYMVVEETVWETLTCQEEPLPETITVPWDTPVPTNSWPTASAPEVTEPTVKVVFEIVEVAICAASTEELVIAAPLAGSVPFEPE